eukprot:TRINITY_DN15193_c0_g1_i1.p1 TRINITY_DN15193_c0_g1~~TRINITY_DN15193_c0_g1_i1.p1  ORF type:complete len:591 (+),score=105.38 TRINITY_DN15193_c0_g1_i1:70-1842(+)
MKTIWLLQRRMASGGSQLVVPDGKPSYLDFSGMQGDVMRGVGLRTVAAGEGIAHAAVTDKCEYPPDTLRVSIDRNLPPSWRVRFPSAKHPFEKRELVEEMFAFNDTDSPEKVVLRLFQSFPYLILRDDAAAVVFSRFNKLAEEQFRVHRKTELWHSKVYPFFVFQATRNLSISAQEKRAVEFYLLAAVERGEVSKNYANYFIQNINNLAATIKSKRKYERFIACGDFSNAMEMFSKDTELDFKLYQYLMQSVPDFFSKYPRLQPQTRDEFIKDCRNYEVTYVLHYSYLLDTSPEFPTMLSRAKHIVELIEGDDQNSEMLLVPYWTIEELLLRSFERDENVTETLSYLGEKFSVVGNRVKFVWPSELVSPMISYRKLGTIIDNTNDKIITFAKWLDLKLPPLTQQEIMEWEEECESQLIKLSRSKLYGVPLSVKKRIELGMVKNIPRKVKGIMDIPEEEPQQGTILLASDKDIQKQCRKSNVWVEPQEDHARTKDYNKQFIKTQWYRFSDGKPKWKQNQQRLARNFARKYQKKQRFHGSLAASINPQQQQVPEEPPQTRKRVIRKIVKKPSKQKKTRPKKELPIWESESDK